MIYKLAFLSFDLTLRIVRHSSIYVFCVVLSSFQRLSSSTLFNGPLTHEFTKSAHVNDVEWLKFNIFVVFILSLLLFLRPKRFTIDMTAVACARIHPCANPGYPQQYTEYILLEGSCHITSTRSQRA